MANLLIFSTYSNLQFLITGFEKPKITLIFFILQNNLTYQTTWGIL